MNNLWAPVCTPWYVAACVLICEREFEKLVNAVYDGKRAVSVIFIAFN
jgi:hypothetical protein